MSNARNLANLLGAGGAVTGNVTTTGTVEPAGDTAAGDNAAIGFTAAEGLILTGQGTTNDVTIKNDADADVIEIPTGTTNVTVAGTLGSGGLITSGAGITGAGLLTTGGNIVIPNAGTIGSAGDADAMAIASNGIVTFSAGTVGAGVALTTATTVAATSGSSINFTGIPSTTSRIMLMFRGVAMSANQNIRIFLGTSSGLVTSGYLGTSGYGAGADDRTDSWVWYPANGTLSGVMTICHMGGNIYVQGHSSKYNANNTSFGGGDVAVGGVVDRLGIDTSGNATFSAGAINIMFD